MPLSISDGAGKGNLAAVNDENQLQVIAETLSLPNFQSATHGQAFTAIGEATCAAATVVALHLKNTDVARNLVVYDVHLQVVDAAGGTAFPSAANYYEVALNRTVASGGSAVTAANMNTTSGNTPSVTLTDSAPTMAGTAAVIDKDIIKDDGFLRIHTYDGAVILGNNETLELSMVGDHTSGTIVATAHFAMVHHGA